MSAAGPEFRVLFVCTGNVCRSPTAEFLFRDQIAQRRLQGVVAVESAGVGSQDGWRIDATVAKLLDRRGLEGLGGFRSRALSADTLAAADVALTGTREHRLRLGKTWPEAYSRTFTLRECAWLLRNMPPDVAAELPGELPDRGLAVVRWLQAERGVLVTPDDQQDVDDPIGRRLGVYRRMIDTVAEAVDIVAAGLLGPAVN